MRNCTIYKVDATILATERLTEEQRETLNDYNPETDSPLAFDPDNMPTHSLDIKTTIVLPTDNSYYYVQTLLGEYIAEHISTPEKQISQYDLDINVQINKLDLIERTALAYSYF